MSPCGERGVEGGQDDPGVWVVAGEATCPVDRDDGLAGAGATGKPERTGVIRLDVLALFGMQERPPRGEVAAFDDAAQFFVVLDERELHLRGRAFQRLDDLLVSRRGTCPPVLR